MKRLLIASLLGAMSIGASAQSAPDSTVQVRGYQIELPAHPYHMHLGEFDLYRGGYTLSNGDEMGLFQRGSHMYAVIGDRPMTEMVAASRDEFVAVDQQFKMKLARDQGEVSGEVLLRVPSTSSMAGAGGGEVVSLMASR